VTDSVEAAISELRLLTECLCTSRWTGGHLHAPGCLWEYRTDVDVLAGAAAANPPAPVPEGQQK
jgi:hypothetical protein